RGIAHLGDQNKGPSNYPQTRRSWSLDCEQAGRPQAQSKESANHSEASYHQGV
ncbi:hypothetical protein FRC01_013578, partial [Tulasnella sp. 417]